MMGQHVISDGETHSAALQAPQYPALLNRGVSREAAININCWLQSPQRFWQVAVHVHCCLGYERWVWGETQHGACPMVRCSGLCYYDQLATVLSCIKRMLGRGEGTSQDGWGSLMCTASCLVLLALQPGLSHVFWLLRALRAACHCLFASSMNQLCPAEQGQEQKKVL